ncbi:thioesterase II family protein [Staphylospora marina]|uniref:thioesterase II family protein n=1 Tax=Staphylospora marina TaxID=2490858 RepID=UPI0013DE0908|nr:alpha/beta fold hydrolase [Staphylospora marina]
MTHGETVQLFCFPYAGGSARIYRSWKEHLPERFRVHPVELPGRGVRFREKPYRQLPVLIEDLAGEILKTPLRSPFVLFGHSMGAMLAFELARWFRRNLGEQPMALLVSAFRAPHLPRRKDPIHLMSDRRFAERIREMGGTPGELMDHPEWAEFFAPVIRADLEVAETYQYVFGRPLTCPVIGFAGIRDAEVTPQEVDGWRSVTEGPFKLKLFPGGHFFLQEDEAAVTRAVAHELKFLLGGRTDREVETN